MREREREIKREREKNEAAAQRKQQGNSRICAGRGNAREVELEL